MVLIRCDNCEQSIQVDTPIVGLKVKCPNCGDVNVLRSAAPADPTASRPDRAAAAGYPPANGPEAEVLSIRPAMFRARPWRFLLLTVVALAGLGGGTAAAATGLIPLGIVAGALGLIAAVWLGVWKIATLGEGIRVTTKRIVDREGLFSKATSEVLHADIRNIQVKQRFVQRLLNVGTIAISCAAENEDEVFMEDVPAPDRVRAVIDLYRPL